MRTAIGSDRAVATTGESSPLSSAHLAILGPDPGRFGFVVRTPELSDIHELNNTAIDERLLRNFSPESAKRENGVARRASSDYSPRMRGSVRGGRSATHGWRPSRRPDGWNPPTASASSSRRVVTFIGASSVTAANVARCPRPDGVAGTATARAAAAPPRNCATASSAVSGVAVASTSRAVSSVRRTSSG